MAPLHIVCFRCSVRACLGRDDSQRVGGRHKWRPYALSVSDVASELVSDGMIVRGRGRHKWRPYTPSVSDVASELASDEVV
jgi:hypothetical protein